MKKITLIAALLLAFSGLKAQDNQTDTDLLNVYDWIIYKGDTLAITSISGDTIFVTRGATLDTLIAGGVNHWTITANDIQNNNTGKVILPDSLYANAMHEANKVYWFMGWNNTTGRFEKMAPTIAGDKIDSARAASPTAYTTWVRDSTELTLSPATPTDKIKEVYTQERQKKGYVTFSFDDGYASDYDVMYPLFTAKGINGESIIVTDWVGNPSAMTWVEINDLQDNGWGILSHSANHINLDTATIAELIIELKGSKDTLEAHGLSVESVAYPFGGYDDTVKMYARKYYRSGRGTGGSSGNTGYINTSPLNTFGLTTYTLDLPSDTTVAKTLIDSVANYNGWLIFYIHQTITEDSIAIARMIDYIQAAGLSIVTTSQALDSIGNSLDVSGGWCVNDNDMRIEGTIYSGYLPYIHSPVNGGANGRNFFAGLSAGNLTLSPAGGAVTLASQNTGAGYFSLKALTIGYNCTALGALSAYKNTTGYNITAIGANAAGENTTGNDNTAIGANASRNNTTNSQTTTIGSSAGYYNTGSNNTLIGYNSGNGASSGATGEYNVAIGSVTFASHTGANFNTVVGYGGLNLLTSGDYNTIGGASAAANFTTASYNTSFGFRTFYTNSIGTYNIALGYRAGYKETGSYKSYWAADSTSWANGMASGSKLLWYADMSNAAKSVHYMNIFAKVAIGEAKALSAYELEVVGDVNITGVGKYGTGSIADNDSTPSVAAGNTFVYAGSANAVSIDALDDHIVGAYYTIFGNSGTYTITIPDGSVAGGDSFNLAGAWVGGVDDCITLYCIAADTFKEVSRSDN